MRYSIDGNQRKHFQEWLRGEFRRLDYYTRRGSHYLVSEFHRDRYCGTKGETIHLDLVSLGRYINKADPPLPTPETCRALAKALGRHPLEVLLEAGYVVAEDFEDAPDDLWRRVRKAS